MKRRSIIGALLGLPIVSCIALIAVASTSWGERQARQFVADAVSDAIPGTVTIDNVRDISLLSPPGRVSADVWNVEFETETHLVLQIEQARLTYSWIALLSGEVLIDEATVRGGTVTIEPNPQGDVYLVRAFDRESAGAPAAGAPIGIALRNLRAHDMNVLIRWPNRLVQLEDVTGVVDIAREEGGNAIVVTLSDISGVVAKPNVLGSKLSLSGTSGTVGGSKPAVVDLDVTGEFMSSDIAGSVRYLPKGSPKVEISIKPDGAAGQFIANVADLKTIFGDQVSIDVRK